MAAELTLTDALAVYRLTRAVIDDSHDMPWLVPVRRWAEEVLRVGSQSPSEWAAVIECPWCASWWVALGVLAGRRVMPRAWSVARWALAASAASGLLRAAEELLGSARSATEHA